MTGQIERLEWSDVSKKSLRKITRAKKCSSNGKCCSFGSASTYQNHCYRLVIAKTKIMSRHWGFLSSGWIQNQKCLNCDNRFFLMLCERERIAVQSGCQRHSPAKTKKYLAQEKFQRMAQGTKAQVSLSKWWNKWVAPDTIGALLTTRMTNFSNTSTNTTEKIKGRYENKKLCFHKCTYCLLLAAAGNLNVPVTYFWLETFSVTWDG